MQPFPAYATISLALISENFLEACFCNNFQLMQQFFSFSIRIFFMLAYATIFSLWNNFLAFLSEIFLEACLCNNFQCMQQFFAFLSEVFYASLCNMPCFLAFLLELPLEACLWNNFQLMQQFFSFPFRTFS